VADLAVARPLKDHGSRVRVLLIVVEVVLAAQSGHGRGMRLDAQAPAGVIDLVRTVAAQAADAEVVPPVPVVVKTAGLIRVRCFLPVALAAGAPCWHDQR